MYLQDQIAQFAQTLQQGAIVFIAGAAGAGKTTIARLLQEQINLPSVIVHADDEDFTLENTEWVIKNNTYGVVIIEGSPAVPYLSDIEPTRVVWVDADETVRRAVYINERNPANFIPTLEYAKKDLQSICDYCEKEKMKIVFIENTDGRKTTGIETETAVKPYGNQKGETPKTVQHYPQILPIVDLQNTEAFISHYTNYLQTNADNSVAIETAKKLCEIPFTLENYDTIVSYKKLITTTATAQDNFRLGATRPILAVKTKIDDIAKDLLKEVADAMPKDFDRKFINLKKQVDEIKAAEAARIAAEKAAAEAEAKRLQDERNNLLQRWVAYGLLVQDFELHFANGTYLEIMEHAETECKRIAAEEERKYQDQKQKEADAAKLIAEQAAQLAAVQAELAAYKAAKEPQVDIQPQTEVQGVKTPYIEPIKMPLSTDEVVQPYEVVAIAKADQHGTIIVDAPTETETETLYTHYSVFVPMGSEHILEHFCAREGFDCNKM